MERASAAQNLDPPLLLADGVKAGVAFLEARGACNGAAVAGEGEALEELDGARVSDLEVDGVVGAADLAVDLVLLAVLVGVEVASDVPLVIDAEVQFTGAA